MHQAAAGDGFATWRIAKGAVPKNKKKAQHIELSGQRADTLKIELYDGLGKKRFTSYSTLFNALFKSDIEARLSLYANAFVLKTMPDTVSGPAYSIIMDYEGRELARFDENTSITPLSDQYLYIVSPPGGVCGLYDVLTKKMIQRPCHEQIPVHTWKNFFSVTEMIKGRYVQRAYSVTGDQIEFLPGPMAKASYVINDTMFSTLVHDSKGQLKTYYFHRDGRPFNINTMIEKTFCYDLKVFGSVAYSKTEGFIDMEGCPLPGRPWVPCLPSLHKTGYYKLLQLDHNDCIEPSEQGYYLSTEGTVYMDE